MPISSGLRCKTSLQHCWIRKKPAITMPGMHCYTCICLFSSSPPLPLITMPGMHCYTCICLFSSSPPLPLITMPGMHCYTCICLFSSSPPLPLITMPGMHCYTRICLFSSSPSSPSNHYARYALLYMYMSPFPPPLLFLFSL